MTFIMLIGIILLAALFYAIPTLQPFLFPYCGGMLVLATRDGYVALRDDNGQRLWITPSKYGRIKSTISTDGTHIIVRNNLIIHVLDAQTGRFLWQHAETLPDGTPLYAPRLLGMGGGVLVCVYEISNADFNFASSQAIVEALDLVSGKLRWQLTIPKLFDAAMDGNSVFLNELAGETSRIRALNAQTDALLWQITSLPSQYNNPLIALPHGILIVGGQNYQAYDEQTGSLLWSDPSTSDYDSPFGNVLLTFGYDAQTAQSDQLTLTAHDPFTFALLWQTVIHQPIEEEIIPPNMLIMLEQDGNLSAIDLSTGTERRLMPFPDWSHNASFFSSYTGDKPTYFGTAVQGLRLYWDTAWSQQQTKAYAFQFAANPAVLWQFDGTLMTASTLQGVSYPVQGDGSIFGVTNTSQLVALNPQTGAIRWQISTASFGFIVSAIDIPGFSYQR